MVLDCLIDVTELALEDICDARMRRGPSRAVAGGPGFPEVHRDERRPVAAVGVQFPERLERRDVRRIAVEGAPIPLNRAFRLAEPFFRDLAYPVHERDALARRARCPRRSLRGRR